MLRNGLRKLTRGNMTESENTDVVTEAVAPPVEEQPHVYHEEHAEEAPAQTGQSDKEINFAAMRERQDALERDLELANLRQKQQDDLINALKGQVQQPQPVQAAPEVDELDNIAPDEWLTREQFEKLQKRNTQKDIDAALAAERQRRAQEELPERIKREHKDFDQVVSKENVEYLKATKPYLAQTLAATQDPYAQAMAAYDMIKTHCPSAQVTQDKQRAEKNAQKPGTLDSAGPARTSDFDPKRINADTKAQLWKEMQAAARG
jgi:hypothetical protein